MCVFGGGGGGGEGELVAVFRVYFKRNNFKTVSSVDNKVDDLL